MSWPHTMKGPGQDRQGHRPRATQAKKGHCRLRHRLQAKGWPLHRGHREWGQSSHHTTRTTKPSAQLKATLSQGGWLTPQQGQPQGRRAFKRAQTRLASYWIGWLHWRGHNTTRPAHTHEWDTVRTYSPNYRFPVTSLLVRISEYFHTHCFHCSN